MTLLTWWQKILLFLFFSLLATSLLSPIASNTLLPDRTEFVVHMGGIVQAKMALDEGQFPLRICPWDANGIRSPEFQFYSPFPYTLGGSLFKWVISNPYVVLKLLLWGSLFIAGIYTFRLTHMVTNCFSASLISSVAYLFAPYFLVNIHARGDMTETMAQGLTPVVLYYTFKSYSQFPNIRASILAAICWGALSMTHLVTFIYNSAFIGLFFVLLTLFWDTGSLRKLIGIGVVYVFGCLIALWYLVPIAMISKYLPIRLDYIPPYAYQWLTPLTTLLSPTAVSPIPQSNALTLPIYCSIGWPILIGVATIGYAVCNRKNASKLSFQLGLPLLFIFLLAFFATWSPFDFWRYLPRPVAIVQFPYRMLTQTMWAGVLLLSLAIIEIFKGNRDNRHTLIGICLISFFCSSWLPATMPSSTTTLQNIRHKPSFGLTPMFYFIYKNSLPDALSWNNPQILPASFVKTYCAQNKTKTVCNITTAAPTEWIQLPLLYYPQLWDVKVNGQEAHYAPIESKTMIRNDDSPESFVRECGGPSNATLIGINVKPGTYHITAEFRGIRWANWISGSTSFFLISALLFSFILGKRNAQSQSPLAYDFSTLKIKTKAYFF